MHPNPNVVNTVFPILEGVKNFSLIEPLDYLPLVHLMKRCYLVVTDSGGIQEEAPGLGKPVLVLREKTERPEGITAGPVKLIGTDRERIFSSIQHLLNDDDAYTKMAKSVNPYGDGNAAEYIIKRIIDRADQN